MYKRLSQLHVSASSTIIIKVRGDVPLTLMIIVHYCIVPLTSMSNLKMA